jgi:hypothetical protein
LTDKKDLSRGIDETFQNYFFTLKDGTKLTFKINEVMGLGANVDYIIEEQEKVAAAKKKQDAGELTESESRKILRTVAKNILDKCLEGFTYDEMYKTILDITLIGAAGDLALFLKEIGSKDEAMLYKSRFTQAR